MKLIGFYANLVKCKDNMQIFLGKYDNDIKIRFIGIITYLYLAIYITIITFLLIRRYTPTDKKGYIKLFEKYIKKHYNNIFGPENTYGNIELDEFIMTDINLHTKLLFVFLLASILIFIIFIYFFVI